MRPGLVVSGPERLEVVLDVRGGASLLPPFAEPLLEAFEEPLGPAAPPWAKRVKRLVADTQGEESDTHQARAMAEARVPPRRGYGSHTDPLVTTRLLDREVPGVVFWAEFGVT